MRFLSRILLSLLACLVLTSCSSSRSIKRNNRMLPLLLPFAKSRAKQAFDHSILYSHRSSSDCKGECPDIDVWQYRYKINGKLLTSDTPISSQKAYWKNDKEARVIAISLFGNNDFYYQALLQNIESFTFIKKANNITDDIWGYETFTLRIYVPGRNPKHLPSLGPIKGALSQDKITHLLDLGCEIAFTDNKLESAQKDATFWRFMVMQEKMPEGQTIRYLLRDADSLLTAEELYCVADWIKSSYQFHRMHNLPICMGPLTASIWGGKHEGKGSFADFYHLVKNYPYRFEYGDDELFSRDLIWPRMKALGSILTHHKNRRNYLFFLANPYKNSCEEPTVKFCKQMGAISPCADKPIPENFHGGIEVQGERGKLADLAKKDSKIFELDLTNPKYRFVYEVFRP